MVAASDCTEGVYTVTRGGGKKKRGVCLEPSDVVALVVDCGAADEGADESADESGVRKQASSAFALPVGLASLEAGTFPAVSR